ncbi:hypothetical protein D0Z67_29315 (plasmid) [Streptomyces seoulensis]|uniref:DUF7352 domain-containing protein n=1 Tax=Streptomyces seoulensis TaxID=73044 RepID=A0A4P6U5G6_STRSO|nr:hypothetical protein [Streptomyces seoulensis]QBJ94471.1 hypothetical protein D0Z67_29315 [Streptomyces seoulensis]
MTTPPPQAIIHRIELPIDDRPHGIDLTGEILHTAIRRPNVVDVWYQARPAGMDPMRRSFQVVGTGQPIPTHLGFYIHAGYKGTAITPDGQLVWHVLENWCPHPNIVETTELRDKPGYGTGICECCPVVLRGDGNGGWLPI